MPHDGCADGKRASTEMTADQLIEGPSGHPGCLVHAAGTLRLAQGYAQPVSTVLEKPSDP